MYIAYCLAQIFCSPLIALFLAFSWCLPKYRERLPARLGAGLSRILASLRPGPRIWVHALSVGEVQSALPLLQGLGQAFPGHVLLLSVTTGSGLALARERAAPLVDAVLPAPLDLVPVTRRFVRCIAPSLFILVETDFWPGWLMALDRKQVPRILVNGRISPGSLRNYQRVRCLSRALLSGFARLCMQGASDVQALEGLGVAGALALGNLKFAGLAGEADAALERGDLGLPSDSPLWVAGSTHEGEEELVLQAHIVLRRRFPGLCLVLAPRAPERGDQVTALVQDILGLVPGRRSLGQGAQGGVLVLDTLGELASCYPLARLAFVGGSLVPEGGHNPLEVSRCGLPVLFGPHMEDFQDLARDLVDAGAARQVQGLDDLVREGTELLRPGSARQVACQAARDFMGANQGVVERHLRVIAPLLNGEE